MTLKNVKSLNFLDLFCGAGGFSKGFDDGGFETVLGIDFNNIALKTFEHNHPYGESLKLDLFNINNVNKIEKNLNDRNLKIDVLIGGPPCQGFSMAGKRIVDDEKNALYRAMVETAKKLKPKIIVLENVPHILNMGGGIIKEKILNDFNDIGYYINVKVLFAPEYGVPQNRKRAFFIAVSKDFLKKEYNLKLKTNKEIDLFIDSLYPDKKIKDPNFFITTGDALSDLPDLNNVKDITITEFDYKTNPVNEYQQIMREKIKPNEKVKNSNITIHKEDVIKTINLVPEGKNSEYLLMLKNEGKLPKELMNKNFSYRNAYTRMDSKKLAKTIDTGHGNYFHYKENRIINVRESARLQSFPDDFIFLGSKTQQLMQVGNAVPPLLAKAIAEKIKEFLENKKQLK